MEHKLIQGGEQYLPFARSRIKALRATGLSHASQQFEIDGVGIKVRIAGEHEYIRLEGGDTSVALDSGVVNLFSINPEVSDGYRAGVLYATNYRNTYDSGFTVDPAPPTGDRIRSGAGAIDGTVSLTGGKISGRIGPDADEAKSFLPKWVPDNLIPPGKIRDPASGDLVQKKIAAVTVPASVFTGKCRLYVQALYGRHLYDVAGVVSKYPVAAESGSSTPWLLVPAFRRPASPYSPPVVVSTSTGIFWDKTNGKHWMLRIGYGEITIYPMAVPGNIVPLRTRLKQQGLTDDDWDHLEAYVLGYSLPDPDGAQVVSLSEQVSTYSMGYGWHWNYSGTEAEIVINGMFEYAHGDPLGAIGMKSSRFHVSVSLADGVWGAALTAPERDVEWSLDRNHWTVVEPSWADGTALKVTSGRFDLDLLPGKGCNAPFYVFYDRDTLNVCRVAVSYGAVASERTSSTPYYAGGNPFSSVSAASIGYSGGRVDDRGAYDSYTATFSVGSKTTPGLPVSTSRAWHTTISSEKTPSGVFSAGYSVSYGPNIVVTTGIYPNLAHTDLGYGGIRAGQYEQLSYTLRDINGTETVSSFFAAIVPKYDAEAIYIRGRKYSSRAGSGTAYIVANQGTSSSLWSEKQTFIDSTNGGGTTDYFSQSFSGDWPNGFANYTTSATTESQNSTEWDTSLLICRGGEIPTPIESLNQLFSVGPNDLVNEYYVRCGTRHDSVVIQALAPTLTAAGALPEPSVPAIVGWI